MSLGTTNPTHRISRRKSMTSSAFNNVTALAAAINGGSENYADSMRTNRRSLPSKHCSNGGTAESTIVVRSDGLADGRDADIMDTAIGPELVSDVGTGKNGSAIAEGFLPSNRGGVSSKARNRRASEGAPLSKGEGKRVSGELRCEKCGKGYKHSSCLTKHLWEHTPEWSYTSKLLISKHQQVQLLEAASVLVGMNQDSPDIAETTKMQDSDHSSASPAASGASDLHDDYLSSAETTPPPHGEHMSYQSASSMPVGSVPINAGQRRPSTSGIGAQRHMSVDEEEAGLAAAVESLCSFGTPRSGAVQLPPDVPPVPPLPARFASHNINRRSGSAIPTMVQPSLDLPPPSLQRLSNERDELRATRRKSDAMEDEDLEDHPASRSRNDEDDEIMFGRDEAIF
ncbi:hypothetical protein G7Y79_00004g013800 [Physcia stellaris]|nr:hypothetical protein G7Y79_00004g013800 [Physcia stellaris]